MSQAVQGCRRSHIAGCTVFPDLYTTQNCDRQLYTASSQLVVFCQAKQKPAPLQSDRQQGPDISQLSTKLQQQWDHENNANLGHRIISPHSGIKASWSCGECPDGHPHQWQQTVHSRTFYAGCPFCTSRRVCKHNSLAIKAPDVAASWDYKANKLTPDDYTSGSGYMAGWICPTCGQNWDARIRKRVGNSTGCPHCHDARRGRKADGSRTRHPTFQASDHPLMLEWDEEANIRDGLFPDKITLCSNKQVNWVCHSCPVGCVHRYKAKPTSRTVLKSGCPYCFGHKACKCNSLQALFPDIAQEWDSGRNKGTPDDYASKSAYNAWWTSAERSSWQQTLHSRTDSRLVRH